MTDAVFAIPGDLATPTGGYAYARHVLAEWSAGPLRVTHLPLPGSFPEPSAEDLAVTEAAFARLPAGAALLVDGLAYGALPAPVIRAAGERPLVALVHHPLGLEAGLAPARAEALVASERAALALAHRIVATSPFTRALLMRDFGVAAQAIVVAEPGTAPAARVPVRTTGTVSLLSVGTVIPRKAHHLLVEALAGLGNLDWRLTIAGALDRDPACAAALRRTVAERALGERVRLIGAVTRAELDRLYTETDVLVSASLFEGYGMALTEGLARGLPLVASTGGAAADTVPDAAAAKVPPGDVGALRTALHPLIADPRARRAAADASWAAGRRLPRWADTAQTIARCLREARP
ncbi:glycosyltransferase family 4 protein [Methylobacterium sp. ID0610]|uniref:glycosyltransferase family 4 protein n=1 Tax=Methylobacterium carpenticola TaxID=3344827 RepID=UPI00367427C1